MPLLLLKKYSRINTKFLLKSRDLAWVGKSSRMNIPWRIKIFNSSQRLTFGSSYAPLNTILVVFQRTINIMSGLKFLKQFEKTLRMSSRKIKMHTLHLRMKRIMLFTASSPLKIALKRLQNILMMT